MAAKLQQATTSTPLARKLLAVLVAVMISGCSSLPDARPIDWWRNGLKLGPNYRRPAAPVASDWIDYDDPKLLVDSTDVTDFAWWRTLGDPVLDELVQSTYSQNLTLRAAGQRVLQARYQTAIATGSLFPQHQSYDGRYTRLQRSRRGDLTGLNELNNRLPTPIQIPRTFDSWQHGFSLGWELDVWGRFRRAIEASDARLDESVNNYDAILVSLLADTATAYVQVREYQERIRLAQQNVELQQQSYGIAKARFDQGAVTELDIDQATATLANTEALLPQLRIQQRVASNQLCVLMGMPPSDLAKNMSPAPIPDAPSEVVVGIPAELIRRRPDIRAAERRVAAESALIGVATAELYPAFSITGTLGWHAGDFDDVFSSAANYGTVGPGFHWDILNYGRLANNVRLQESKYCEQVALYKQTVLNANQEAEDAIVSYLQSQELVAALQKSVDALKKSSDVAVIQYRNGKVDYNRVATVQSELVTYQDNLAAARASVALSLIQVYKALGGGWQIRCRALPPLVVNSETMEVVPQPAPEVDSADAVE
ncbi:efflux transporter outer membrane subunit [Aeoliella sp.]|uniref:efflux transporter outer membrane subunit n=1 Tax=Aeoliella sp. TaxID=2795800 RepID=UPI003CCC3F59